MAHQEDTETLEEIKKMINELKQTKAEIGATAAVRQHTVYRRLFSNINSRMIMFSLLLLLLLTVFLGIRSIFVREGETQKVAGFVEQIQDLSTLATSKAYMKAVVEQEDNQLFGQKIDANLPGTKRKILIIIPGEVIAGVDLSKVTKSDLEINEDHKTIHLILPKAEIIQKPTLYFDQAQIFSSEGLFRSEASIDEGYAFAELAQDQIVAEATEQGLLTSAEEQAIKVIETFMNRMGYKVTIEYKDN